MWGAECIHRNRLKHRYLAIIDADEFFWHPPANVSLKAYLASLFPRDVASLVFSDIMYPEPCQVSAAFWVIINPQPCQVSDWIPRTLIAASVPRTADSRCPFPGEGVKLGFRGQLCLP